MVLWVQSVWVVMAMRHIVASDGRCLLGTVFAQCFELGGMSSSKTSLESCILIACQEIELFISLLLGVLVTNC